MYLSWMYIFWHIAVTSNEVYLALISILITSLFYRSVSTNLSPILSFQCIPVPFLANGSFPAYPESTLHLVHVVFNCSQIGKVVIEFYNSMLAHIAFLCCIFMSYASRIAQRDMLMSRSCNMNFIANICSKWDVLAKN